MAQSIMVARDNELAVGEMKSVQVHNLRILICRLEDGYYAVADECSHDYAPISTGRLKGTEVICPRHGARFDVRTGEAKAPPAVVGIDSFPVKVEQGNVYVEIDF